MSIFAIQSSHTAWILDVVNSDDEGVCVLYQDGAGVLLTIILTIVLH